MPEHPPCLTPILKHKSSSRSFLILFKCFNALSVSEIAGAIPSVAGTAKIVHNPKKKTLNHKLNQILNLQPKYIHNQEEGVPADDVDRTERSNLRLRFDLENGKEREF